MKTRLLSGWNFQRVLFLCAGSAIVAEAIADGQWPGFIAGIYFAAMGLFGFGCAAGNCAVNYRSPQNKQNPPDLTSE